MAATLQMFHSKKGLKQNTELKKTQNKKKRIEHRRYLFITIVPNLSSFKALANQSYLRNYTHTKKHISKLL